jgi:hypothetical protein
VTRIHTATHRFRLPAALGRLEPYAFHIAMAVFIPALLYADARTQTLTQQHLLGVVTFAFLLVALRFSPPSERRQVWVLVLIATAVEIFGSGIWGVYSYRFSNIPLFVPPGHGLIYLFALRSIRTPLMVNNGKAVCRIALLLATLWAVGGVTVGPLVFGRLDVTALLLWPIFVLFMWKSSSAGLYAAAFVATSVLEILGTAFGNWSWVTVVPVLQLAAGNPPSVIAGAYCLMDLAAAQAMTLLKEPSEEISELAENQAAPSDRAEEAFPSGGESILTVQYRGDSSTVQTYEEVGQDDRSYL